MRSFGRSLSGLPYACVNSGSNERGHTSVAGRVDLSPRQEEIAPLLGRGATYREIGDELEIAERTVKYHVDRMKLMMGARSRYQLVRKLQDAGII